MKQLLSLVALCAVLSGCASGPKHAEVRASIPTLKPEEGRIYFYRSGSLLGAALQPHVLLNGSAVGQSVPGGFFFVDRPAGSMEVATATEVEKKLTFTLDRGQTRYVKTTVGFGIAVGRIYPELIDNATGETEIQDTSYIGQPLK